MLHFIIAIIALLIFLLFDRPESVGGGSTDLVKYTLGDFRALGGFTTLGESVCRAAIYLETGRRGDPILLMPHTGDEVPWLNYHGVALELDGLNEEKKLAFEYDGPQHYSWTEWCKMRKVAPTSERVIDYYRTRFYDRVKTELCRERGIRLIRISTWTAFDAMRSVVAAALDGDFTEGRPVDDAAVIAALENVDTRDSSAFSVIEWQTEAIVLADWDLPRDSIYGRLFHAELRQFVDAMREGLLNILPTGDGTEIYRGVMHHVDTQLAVIAPSPQREALRAAIDEMAQMVARQLNALDTD